MVYSLTNLVEFRLWRLSDTRGFETWLAGHKLGDQALFLTVIPKLETIISETLNNHVKSQLYLCSKIMEHSFSACRQLQKTKTEFLTVGIQKTRQLVNRNFWCSCFKIKLGILIAHLTSLKTIRTKKFKKEVVFWHISWQNMPLLWLEILRGDSSWDTYGKDCLLSW